jgi:hypothetical protein
MNTQYHDKDVNSNLDYGIDWQYWLASGETIVSSMWIVPPELSLNSETFTITMATVWLEGGTVGRVHTVTNRITTSSGRTEDRSLYLSAKNR